jgi:hypothetical protein
MVRSYLHFNPSDFANITIPEEEFQDHIPSGASFTQGPSGTHIVREREMEMQIH